MENNASRCLALPRTASHCLALPRTASHCLALEQLVGANSLVGFQASGPVQRPPRRRAGVGCGGVQHQRREGQHKGRGGVGEGIRVGGDEGRGEALRHALNALRLGLDAETGHKPADGEGEGPPGRA